MDDIVWNKKEGDEKKTSHVDSIGNIQAAREFYKKKTFPKEWDFTMTLAGSPDVPIFWISWHPPAQAKIGNLKYSICTHQPRLSFIGELEDAYNYIYNQAWKYYESKKPKQQELKYAQNS
jgi:hypothetical protein